MRAWSQVSGLGQAGFGPGLVFSESDAVIPDVVWTSNDRLRATLDNAGHLTAAPELVVEVLSLSPADQKRDRQTKLKLYSTRGGEEYWIADRERRMPEIYRRSAGILKLAMTLYEADRLVSPLLPGFDCEVGKLFA